jgi:SAM-dependent methyltransferase
MPTKKSLKQKIKAILPSQLIDSLHTLKYRKISNASIYQNILKNMHGIEIGGPSLWFKTYLPIYQTISSLDCVNFSNTTMWEGSIEEGNSFVFYKNKTGKQIVADAVSLANINDCSYDFLISSNCLEHIANPLKAVEEWKRVIKPGGYLLLLLPRKESNFDHNRTVTSFEHFLEDYRNSISENDLTHLSEILELHDLSRDPSAGSFEQFKARSLQNFSNRGLHHHIFDLDLIKLIFQHFDIELVQADENSTDYFALGKLK